MREIRRRERRKCVKREDLGERERDMARKRERERQRERVRDERGVTT